jgi:hypothetical protein
MGGETRVFLGMGFTKASLRCGTVDEHEKTPMVRNNKPATDHPCTCDITSPVFFIGERKRKP